MAGIICQLIRDIVAKESKGNRTIASCVETKLLLRGIDASAYTPTSPDDPAVIAKLEEIARQFAKC